MPDKILLIDALNFIYRGNVSFKPSEKTSQFTVVYAFFRNLRALIEQFSPYRVFFALEGSNNFRYKLYSDYKANRIIKRGSVVPPELFDAQRDIIVNLLPSLPITLVKANGYEADDTIFNLALSLQDEHITVVSTDKDYTQLLQKGLPNIEVFNPTKKELFKLPDYHFITFLSLAGDSSDNIPGLVSEEVAVNLAQDPDALLDFLSIEENRANFNLNRELIEFKRFDDSEFEFTEYNTDFDYLKLEFERMEFASIIEPKYWAKFINTFKQLET